MPESSGLYVHIPFCRTKCPYCSFDSTPDGEALIDDYIEAVCDEIAARPKGFAGFDTVYFGGGTPGMLTDDQMMRLVDAIRGELAVEPDAEWTVEVNPGDIGAEKARFLVKKAGFNRVSIGVQSFEQNELEFLGRRHDLQDALDAVEDFRMVGVPFGLDLIQGLPGQSVEARMRSLQKAVAQKPAHISVYELTIDEGSEFFKMGDKLPRATQDAVADGFVATSRYLRSRGFIHYEVSNYSAGDLSNASRHNRRYWESRPWLGVGASAHSFDGASRWWNVRGAAAYIQAAQAGNTTVAGRETLTPEQKRLERVALGFRWMGGVAREDLLADGLDGLLQRLAREKLIIVREDRVHSTPEGFLVADGLARVLSGSMPV